MELRTAALKALQVAEPAAKAAAARALAGPGGALDPALLLHPQGPLPGRTERPVLVPVQQVPRRSPFTPEGRAALLHAVAHIELNAINLALDAVWRFPAMPEAYYRDWLRVAAEEALHFSLLAEHLQTLGHAYGAVRFGASTDRDILVMTAEPFQDKAAISDLAGTDPVYHQNDRLQLISGIRRFLARKRKDRPTRSHEAIFKRLTAFEAQLPKSLQLAGTSLATIKSLDYVNDWVLLATAWMKANPEKKLPI